MIICTNTNCAPQLTRRVPGTNHHYTHRRRFSISPANNQEVYGKRHKCPLNYFTQVDDIFPLLPNSDALLRDDGGDQLSRRHVKAGIVYSRQARRGNLNDGLHPPTQVGAAHRGLDMPPPVDDAR
jgi:hypothetical protein